LPVNLDFGAESIAVDILLEEPMGGGTTFLAELSRNGFRDTGRGGGSKGECGCDPADVGDAVRLRNGLLEERLSWEGRLSISVSKQDLVSQGPVDKFMQALPIGEPMTAVSLWSETER
jgi:hypothetical protein